MGMGIGITNTLQATTERTAGRTSNTRRNNSHNSQMSIKTRGSVKTEDNMAKRGSRIRIQGGGMSEQFEGMQFGY